MIGNKRLGLTPLHWTPLDRYPGDETSIHHVAVDNTHTHITYIHTRTRTQTHTNSPLPCKLTCWTPGATESHSWVPNEGGTHIGKETFSCANEISSFPIFPNRSHSSTHFKNAMKIQSRSSMQTLRGGGAMSIRPLRTHFQNPRSILTYPLARFHLTF